MFSTGNRTWYKAANHLRKSPRSALSTLLPASNSILANHLRFLHVPPNAQHPVAARSKWKIRKIPSPLRTHHTNSWLRLVRSPASFLLSIALSQQHTFICSTRISLLSTNLMRHFAKTSIWQTLDLFFITIQFRFLTHKKNTHDFFRAGKSPKNFLLLLRRRRRCFYWGVFLIYF